MIACITDHAAVAVPQCDLYGPVTFGRHIIVSVGISDVLNQRAYRFRVSRPAHIHIHLDKTIIRVFGDLAKGNAAVGHIIAADTDLAAVSALIADCQHILISLKATHNLNLDRSPVKIRAVSISHQRLRHACVKQYSRVSFKINLGIAVNAFDDRRVIYACHIHSGCGGGNAAIKTAAVSVGYCERDLTQSLRRIVGYVLVSDGADKRLHIRRTLSILEIHSEYATIISGRPDL